MIRVENRRTYKGTGVYVGRPTPLGNPFKVPRGYDHANDPDGVLEKYRIWLRGRMSDPDSWQAKIMSGLVKASNLSGDLVLICWCAPKRCHADVIREEIESARKAAGRNP